MEILTTELEQMDFSHDNLSSFPKLATQAGVLVKAGCWEEQGESGVDNGETSEECSSK